MSGPTPDPARPTAYRVLIIPHCSECGASLQLLLSLSGCHAEIVRGGDTAIRRALEGCPKRC
jgi:hypothetical protein